MREREKVTAVRSGLTPERSRDLLSAVHLDTETDAMAHAKQRSTGSAERPSLDGFPTDLSGAEQGRPARRSPSASASTFIRLQFTDILGINKNVEVPRSQFEKALDGEIMFDGSSIEGFVRIEESDMLLKPDLAHLPDPARTTTRAAGSPGCSATSTPRTSSRSPAARAPRSSASSTRARKLGFAMMAGCEAEFFLFEKAPDGVADHQHPRLGAYFDLGPLDQGEEIRRVIVEQLVEMGFEVEAAHHEVAHRPARDRLQVRRRADHGGQPHHLQVRRPQRRQPLRLHRVVHAQADRGHQRQRDAHAPVAVPRQGERVLRSRRPSTSSPRPR